MNGPGVATDAATGKLGSAGSAGHAPARPELAERTRAALGEVESQRDDALAWLSSTRALLDVLARGHGVRGCAPAIARALVAQLGVAEAAVVLREPTRTAWIAGIATQAEQIGAPADAGQEAAWLTLAGLATAGDGAVCFSRSRDGGFQSTPVGEVEGEAFLVLPLVVADKPGGALVLHTLVTPPTIFGRGAGLGLLAEIVGTIITVARGRDATGWLCDRLSEELGAARRTVDQQAAGLQARDRRIATLTRSLGVPATSS